jgi:hypothetical protein
VITVENFGTKNCNLAGHYCEWVHKTVDMSSEKDTFESFFQTLRLECERGEPFYMNWTVPMDAPDLLYYQVKNRSMFKVSRGKF